ncbi:hypothetical protein, partial [Eudoraea chungangensis]|uniref:hypothetical protein n=1 Tax=Eudoraea chungangensis TaxID=1481905 RepID=UPI0023EC7327
YQEGEGLSTVPDCPDGTIVAEYKINDQDWQTGTVMNVAEGDIVYIRARDYSAGEYFVTVPQAYAPTFSSVDDLPSHNAFNAYQVDTFVNRRGNTQRNNGIVGPSNAGQFVLTTAEGCITVVNLVINDTPPPSECISLSAPWSNRDIGNVAADGSACVDNGVYQVEASGRDIW